MSLNTLKKRLDFQGGDAIGRIRLQKLKSFQAALLNDYNSRTIRTDEGKVHQCLLNLNNLKANYDKKYISIDFDSRLSEGDTFEVLDDKTHWMIYLKDLAEIAYLRSEIIRCRYTIDVDGHTYWIYFRGPEETDITWEQKSSVNFTSPNLSGLIYIKKDDTTKNFFKRFKKIKLEGHNWEVEDVDYISVPGIIEIQIQEDYDNLAEDLPEIKKEKDIVDDDEIIPNIIIGSKTVKQESIVGYTILDAEYNKDYKWEILDNPLVEIVETFNDNRICKVEIKKGAIRGFSIKYGDNIMHVDIDLIDSVITGDSIVYPYSEHTYFIESANGGEFFVDNKFAVIKSQFNNTCELEIVASRKGNFNLYFDEYNSGERFVLPIAVKSL